MSTEPPIEPSPPITTMANVLMMILSPIVGSTFWLGAASTPPSAASATPTANVIETSRCVSIPSARTSTGASVAARMRAPIGVRSSTYHTTAQTTIATPITKSRYVGNSEKPRFAVPGERRRRRIRRAERAGREPHRVLDDQHEREREQQSVQRVEPVEPAQEQHLDQKAEHADDERRDEQRTDRTADG